MFLAGLYIGIALNLILLVWLIIVDTLITWNRDHARPTPRRGQGGATRSRMN